MEKHKINFTLVIVKPINENIYEILNKNKNLTKSEIGCSLSHLWCLNQIIKEKLSNAIIFEDDIIFHIDLKNRLNKIFEQNIKPFDFLLLGACDFHFKKKHYKNVVDNLYRPDPSSKHVYGAHAIYYSQKGAQKMFELTNTNFSFFDKQFYSIFNYFKETSFICYPNLVITDISNSNINHKYSFFSKEEECYYQNCFSDTFSFKEYNIIYISFFIQNSIPLLETDNYESYITKLINSLFTNKKQQEEIKNRLKFDFFTINDLKQLLYF
jgi:glycosyl transferase family 25